MEQKEARSLEDGGGAGIEVWWVGDSAMETA